MVLTQSVLKNNAARNITAGTQNNVSTFACTSPFTCALCRRTTRCNVESTTSRSGADNGAVPG